jgi:hypothetical protein
MRTTQMTAATLRAILCYIDSGVTPPIAYDKDEYAKPLADKIRAAVGDRGGSQSASVMFDDSESELRRQFVGVCENISNTFGSIVRVCK